MIKSVMCASFHHSSLKEPAIGDLVLFVGQFGVSCRLWTERGKIVQAQAESIVSAEAYMLFYVQRAQKQTTPQSE